MTELGVVVSAHGFGHGARAVALMAALLRRRPELRFRVCTTVPSWFFAELGPAVTVVETPVDVGLVQEDGFRFSVADTRKELADLRRHWQERVELLGRHLAGCAAVLCDIAPLGIAAARRLSVPAVLVENFTWDWIYRRIPGLVEYAAWLDPLFAADCRIQTAPWCDAVPCDLRVAPMSRRPRVAPPAVRERLGVTPEERLVLVSLGGVPTAVADGPLPSGVVLVQSAPVDVVTREGRRVLVPRDGDIGHVDLMAACQVLVCKAGYSTLAEAWWTGIPLAIIGRQASPESLVLERYARQELGAMVLEWQPLADGSWTESLPALLARPSRPRPATNGSDSAADFLVERLGLG